VGNRVRVAVRVPQPVTAELTASAVESLHLRPGTEVVAVLKATATRIVAV